ncbi:hypothetical protein NQ315_010106 [Exocentrus adspersus]|uniref:Uncharacterized protein n=1 Tax=Exocentrus adspersus TaxID=1586481 RepID=A0AAV8WAA0_9CUCU|nr:hypothetical protein NQ315_010106 [Exocentrus adspersus]
MARLLLLLILTKIVSSIVSPNQNSNSTHKDAVDFFGGSDIGRIKNIPTNPSIKKYEPVRKFLSHYNSLKPVAVLVDDTKETCNDAKNFMLRVFEVTPSAKYIQFTFQKFNSSSVTPAVEVKGNSAFGNIDCSQEYGKSYLDPTESNGTAAFFAILNAANALSQNGAILVFIDRKISDEDLASHTGIVRKKNIKAGFDIYVVWGGPYPTKYSQDHLLRELCEYSGGLFLVKADKDLSDYYYRQFLMQTNSPFNTSIILSKKHLTGASELTFPIDSKITGIHVRIAPSISSGSISTPKGYTMDILKKEEIAEFSTGSFGVIEAGLHEIHLNLTTARTHSVGIWRLTIANTRAQYNFTVFAYTKLTAQAYFVEKNSNNPVTSITGYVSGYHESTGSDRRIMKLGISAYIKSISNISFVDKDGQPLADNADYTLVKDSLTENNVSDPDREIDVELHDVSKKPTYALIQGKDSEGNEFLRLSYVSPYNSNDVFPQPTLTIETGTGSELFTTGGKFPVILFEVTNHKSTAVDVRFTCKDDKSILRFLQPYRQIIGPHATATVRLTLVTRFGSYEDEITFTAWIGSEQFTKKVIVDVGTEVLYDNENPEISYNFPSDCSKVVLSSCSEGTWTVKVTAKDQGSGLLQVTSYPQGLYFPTGFTTGTRGEVTGYYSNSCCNPDLQIVATDRLNNRHVVNVNAYLAFWGPAQIAAVVLGILIFILIIVLIVYLIRKCIQRKDNYHLPTYRGGRI